MLQQKLQASATSPVRGEPDFGKLAIADSAGGPTHKLAEVEMMRNEEELRDFFSILTRVGLCHCIDV